MTGSEITFFIFAVCAVGSAAAMVFATRNPVVAGAWLALSFVSVGVCYVLLSASFLAVVEVLILAAATIVLFLSAVMVVDVDEHGALAHRSRVHGPRLGATVGALLCVGAFGGNFFHPHGQSARRGKMMCHTKWQPMLTQSRSHALA